MSQRYGQEIIVTPGLGVLRYRETEGRWVNGNSVIARRFSEILRGMVLDPTIYSYFADAKGIFSQKAFDSQLKEWFSIDKLNTLVKGLSLLPELEKEPDILDQEYYKLNTPTGVLDLYSGALIAHSPEYYFTRVTRGSWDGVLPELQTTHEEWSGESDDNLWNRVIYDIMCEDVEMCQFLQRLMGYTLLGTNPNRILAFFYGNGSNGKSLISNALAHVLGEYHASIRADYLMESREGASPGKLSAYARLRGCRLVTTSELRDGQSWDEAILKDLTGGDAVPAKFMGKDIFEYTPQAFIIIRGNHKPHINGNDKASWQRFLTVGFEADFEKNPVLAAKRDEMLPEKFKAPQMMNHIFGWLMRGFQEYCRIGLCEPSKVMHLKELYKEEMNPFWVFLHEVMDVKDAEFDPELGKNILTEENSILLGDVIRALTVWIELNPAKGLEVDPRPVAFKTFINKHLKYQNVESEVVWNRKKEKAERRYRLSIKPEWLLVINANSIGGMQNFGSSSSFANSNNGNGSIIPAAPILGTEPARVQTNGQQKRSFPLQQHRQPR